MRALNTITKNHRPLHGYKTNRTFARIQNKSHFCTDMKSATEVASGLL